MLVRNLDFLSIPKEFSKVEVDIYGGKSIALVYIGGKGYYPIVEFIVDGRKYRTIGYKKNLKKYEKGLSLPVRYNSEDPTESIVADE